MFTVIQDVTTGAIQDGVIRRLSDGAVIPVNGDNRDYREFLEWIELGGELQRTDPHYSPRIEPDTGAGAA
jgi:hypothetical protein